jgi:hypothetical protein
VSTCPKCSICPFKEERKYVRIPKMGKMYAFKAYEVSSNIKDLLRDIFKVTSVYTCLQTEFSRYMSWRE